MVTRVNSGYVPGNLISIEGYSPDFIAGYEVQEYDLSLDAGRNANGTMHLNYVATKYKIVLKSTPAFQGQLTEFYSHIPMRAMSVTFFNPFTGADHSISAYRGDRTAKMTQDWVGIDKFYGEGIEQSLIEL